MAREDHYRAIWQEGTLADGVHEVARLITSFIGQDFGAACRAYAEANPVWARAFDPATLTHGGRRLFPSYEQARQAYG